MADGDIILGGTVTLTPPVGETAPGAYQAWVEDFNPLPAVDMSTNDVPVVYAAGIRPGGDMALARRYSFEFYAEWGDAAGGAALLTALSALSIPLQTGTATLAFDLWGSTWTLDGRYEPIAMVRSEFTVSHSLASFLVRFRATDPVLHGAVDIL
jgi:hypothetical protein